MRTVDLEKKNIKLKKEREICWESGMIGNREFPGLKIWSSMNVKIPSINFIQQRTWLSLEEVIASKTLIKI